MRAANFTLVDLGSERPGWQVPDLHVMIRQYSDYRELGSKSLPSSGVTRLPQAYCRPRRAFQHRRNRKRGGLPKGA
jgi:hypothetical protein